MENREKDYILDDKDIIEIEAHDNTFGVRQYTYLINGNVFITSSTDCTAILILEGMEGVYTHTFQNNKTKE